MDTSRLNAVKAPLHNGTPRSHDAVILFLFFSVVDDFLPSLRADRRGVLDALLDLFLRFNPAFNVLDDLDLFFFDGFFFADLDLRVTAVSRLAAVFGRFRGVDATRLHQRRRWVVSGPSMNRFGPHRDSNGGRGPDAARTSSNSRKKPRSWT